MPQSTHRVANATFWRTFHHDGKISPAWWGWGVHAHPLSLYLPSRTKLCCTLQRGQIHSMSPKARGLDQHGGPKLVGGEWPGRCDFVRGGRAVSPNFPYSTGCPGAAQQRADGISSCCYIVNVHTIRHARAAWPGTLCIHSLYFYSTTICTLWCKLSLRLSVSVLVLLLSVFLHLLTRLIFFIFSTLNVEFSLTFRNQSDNIYCTLIFPIHNKIGSKVCN
jgi:hypothetical protein